METLESLFTTFTERVTDTCLQQRIAKDIFDRQILDLAAAAQRVELEPDGGAEYMSRWAMSARDITTGELKKFGFSSLDFSARARLAHIHKNRQYQWLLVEVFEEFEVFLAKASAVMGQPTPAGTPASKLLRALRAAMPGLKAAESKNATEIDLSFRTMITEQMRHHIVHTKGAVGDTTKFTQAVMRGLGEASLGARATQRRQNVLAELPLALVDGRQVIALLEVHDTSSRLAVYHSMFDRYASALVTHAQLIVKCAPAQSSQELGPTVSPLGEAGAS